MDKENKKKKRLYRYGAAALVGVAALFLVLVIKPFALQLGWFLNGNSDKIEAAVLPVNNPPETSTSGDDIDPASLSSSTYRVVIPAIGVDMEVVVDEPDQDKALAVGAWHIPGTAAPDNPGGWLNTVISAHRFKYTSGPQTFFHLDKLKEGDLIVLYWDKKKYSYRMQASEIVPSTAVRILDKTEDPTLTLFTCHPVYSTKERLVITAVPEPEWLEKRAQAGIGLPF